MASEPLGPISGARSEAGQIVAAEKTVSLAGARNETLGFAVRLERATLDANSTLRLADLVRDGGGGRLPAAAGEIGQVLPLPVDFNRAGFVRQSGAATPARAVPRAIVPLARRDAGIPFSNLRPESGGATVLWVDLAVPTDTPPGDYLGSIEVVDASGSRVTARLPIRLGVYDLVLPDSRSLTVAGNVSWDALTRHFPDAFEAITPKLINRREDRYKRPVAVLDALVTLAQRHRLSISVDRLQPSVKWGSSINVDWSDFDSLVGPWLDGSAFPDREPLGLWPLPRVDFLSNYPASARRDYFANAAGHFDAKEWLPRAPVWIDAPAGADPSAGPARQRLMETATNVLASHPRLRVALPLEAEQLTFADDAQPSPTVPSRADAARIVTASPGLIFNTPIAPAAARGAAPTFLRTDLAGLIPYAGVGGDERDVRVWACLSYVRGSRILRFDSVLPAAARPDVVADPNELVWFYPGRWFGVEGPVPSLQLKWLRRAEQDHEYLSLATARDERINAFILARLLSKPVQIQPAQRADAAYALMTGTAEPAVWDRGMRILAKLILLRPPGRQQADPAAKTAVGLEMLSWVIPQERPLLLGRETIFSPEPDGGGVGVRIGVDVYNPSDTTPRGNTLGFASLPRGWTVDPKPVDVPPLAPYQVKRFGLAARVDPDAVETRQRARTTVQLTDEFRGLSTPAPMQVPVALSRRREGNLNLNGSLEDWSDDDALTLSPLIRMIDRPTLQAHAAADAATPTAVYSAWGESNVYVAFRVGGLAPTAPQTGQNFVRREFGRAWGEDVCEATVQAVYPDGQLGPALHVAVKPNGGSEGQRKLSLTAADDAAWQPLDVGFRYAYTVDAEGIWRGELAIPWSALGPANSVGGPTRMPALLRFNFVQHQHATGTSASWAGPIDAGRDDLFTGALVLRGGEGR